MWGKHLGSAEGLVGFYGMALGGAGSEQPQQQVFFKEQKKCLSAAWFHAVYKNTFMYVCICLCTLVIACVGMQMWNDGNMSCWPGVEETVL